MKTKFYIAILIISTISCNSKDTNKNFGNIRSTIGNDTLFNKKIPVLNFDLKLKDKLDLIIEKEITCDYYQKNITCFGVSCSICSEDTLLSIFSLNYYLIDFSDENNKSNDNIYGYSKYKGFMFFCLNSCKSINNIFHETKDSVKVKNSIYLYADHGDPCRNDNISYWWFKVKSNKLIEQSRSVCY
jgi:hypothetical protein